jgi:hypothetical protein
VSLNKARVGHSFVEHCGKLYAIGGRSYLDEVHISPEISTRTQTPQSSTDQPQHPKPHIPGPYILRQVQLSDIESMQICETRMKDTGLTEEFQSGTHQLTEFLHVVEVGHFESSTIHPI